jgi:hypothetical protein
VPLAAEAGVLVGEEHHDRVFRERRSFVEAIYSPLEPFFTRAWRSGEIQRVP